MSAGRPLPAIGRALAAALALALLAMPAIAKDLAKDLGGARATAPEAVPEVPASDLLLRYEGPALSFRWALAPEAALEPGLVRELRTEAIAARARAIRTAQQDRAAADPPDPPAHEWQESWHETAETDLLLALSAQTYSFTGGAHGNIALKAVIWDRGMGRRIEFADLFTDAGAAYAALRPEFCRALDDMRRARRGGKLGADFADCPDPAAYAATLVGDGRIGGIRVLVPPYEAGPWVEGSYEVDLDPAAVRPFLRPRYRLAFTAD